MQEVSFPVELIIADDCSPDNTQDVVESFKIHKNYHWIKYTRHIQNKGMTTNFIWALQQTKGKYIALCEGDDYWTDPYKLQKQVDFLEANINCTAVFNRYYILENKKLIPFQNKHLKKNVFTLNEILDDWFIQTATLVFVKTALNMKKRIRDICPFDRTIVYDLALNGNIGFIDEYMTVYRAHNLGHSRSTNYTYAFEHIKNFKLSLDKLNVLTDFIYQTKINRIYFYQLWVLKMKTAYCFTNRLFFTILYFNYINFFNKNKIKSNISLLFPKIYNIYKSL